MNLPLAYVGPETMLPLYSVLAGAVGVLLMCWSFVWRWTKRGFNKLTGKTDVPRLPAEMTDDPALEPAKVPADAVANDENVEDDSDDDNPKSAKRPADPVTAP